MSRIILASLAIFAIVSTVPAAQPTAVKPNIVFLLADDLRPDCLGVLGHPIVKTPNIEKLLENGFIFRNTYVLGSNSGAVCTPSRTMIQTGQSYLRATRTTPTLAETIKAAGYASIRSGKFGNNPTPLDKIFDQHLDGKTAEGNADNIIRFIHEHAGKKPLFLYMAPHEPHDPQYATDGVLPDVQTGEHPDASQLPAIPAVRQRRDDRPRRANPAVAAHPRKRCRQAGALLRVYHVLGRAVWTGDGCLEKSRSILRHKLHRCRRQWFVAR
jgi:arylsulfatase A-like enzyme